MEDIKNICAKCGYEARESGLCPQCQVALVATCAVCGNPVVGEHIHSVESSPETA